MMLENESWREGTVAQRNLHVLNTEHRADCTFLVGITEKKRLRVHKYILSHASPVFDAMFNGELKEKGDVKVEDIEPQPFRKMLEYIYTDNTELENVETALSVCFAANKYMINSLVPKCINFIKKNLDPDIVCRVLAFVRLIDNADLEAESLQYLKTNTSNVLKSTSFPNTERATLLNILSQDHLSITSEVEVFLACIHWTTAHVDAENNLRDVLGPEVLGLIRFLTMTCEEFATVVVPSKLLEAHEERDILCCLITKSGNVPHGFSNSIENRATFRETIEIQTSNMHSRTAQTLNNYPFIFGVNVETYIYGLHLHGLYSGSPVKDSFEIKLLQGSEILASTKFEGWISQGQAIEVNFSKPILLQPVVNYTLQVMYTKSDLLYNAASNERRTIFTTSSSTKSTPPSNQNQIEYNTLNGVKMCMNFISTTIFKICIAKKV